MYTHHRPRSRWFSFRSISLIVAVILVAGASVLVSLANRRPAVVHSSFGGSYSDLNGIIGHDHYELFPSPSGASAMFDDLLNQSKAYQEFSPCFDDRGQRVGEKAALWLHTPPPSKAYWRIVWTRRMEDRSELFSVQADTLDGAHAMELRVREKWKLCRTSH